MSALEQFLDDSCCAIKTFHSNGTQLISITIFGKFNNNEMEIFRNIAQIAYFRKVYLIFRDCTI